MTIKKSLFLRASSLVVAFALTFITVMVFPAEVFADSEDDLEAIVTEITGEVGTDQDGETDTDADTETGTDGNTDGSDDSAQSGDGEQDGSGVPVDGDPIIAVPEEGEYQDEGIMLIDESGLSDDTLQDHINSPSVTIYKNGIIIKEDDVVNNGDELRVTLQWTVDNQYTIKPGDSFTMSLGLENLNLNNRGGSISLANDGNVYIGTYEISDDGTITITIVENTDKFNEQSQRYINVTFDVQVNLSDDDIQSGKESEIVIGETKRTVNSVGNIDVQKSRSGDVYVVEDSTGRHVYQKYHIEATVTGSVSDVTFTDIPGTGFKGYKDGEITIKPNYPYNISNGNLTIDFGKNLTSQTIEIDYILELDEEKFLSKEWSFGNEARFDYKNAENPEGTSSSSSLESAWEINVSVPSISKTVDKPILDKDDLSTNTVLTWTITVDLKAYKDLYSGKLKDLKITDLMSGNMVLEGISQETLNNLTLKDFTHKGDGVYEYTYKTHPTEGSLNSDGKIEFKNTANMTISDHKFSDTATATAPAATVESRFSKEFDDEQTELDENGYMWWTMTVYVADVDYTSMTVYDALSHHERNMHRLVEDNDSVMITIPDKGTVKVNSDDITYDTEYVGSTPIQGLNFTIDLTKYITDVKDKDITITYKTEPVKKSRDGNYVPDDLAYFDSFYFLNQASLNYKIGSSQGSDSDSAEYKNMLNEHVFKKENKNFNGLFPIPWDIEMYANFVAQWEVDDTLTIVDTIPEELVFDKDAGVIFSAADGRAGDLTKFLDEDFYVYNPTENTLTINITITQELYDYLHGLYSYWPAFTYYTNLKPEYTDWFFEQNPARFTNTARLKYNDKGMGSSAKEADIYPSNISIVDKDVVYETDMDDNSKYDPKNAASFGKINAFFSVDINPSGLRLNEGEDITAKDKMGADLQLIKSSVRVYNPNTGEDIPYESSFNPDTNTMTYYALPDETPIRLEYYAAVVGKPASTTENADQLTGRGDKIKNDIEIVAKRGKSDSANIDDSGYILKSSGYAGSEGWGITVWKYTQLGDDKFKALEGATFQLDHVEYNDNDNTWEFKKTIDTKSSDEFGELSFEGLSYDQVYRLTETSPPNGYAASNKEYYFVHTGWDGVTLPSYVQKITFGQMLNVPNVPSDEKLISITVEKKWENDQHTTINAPENAKVEVQLVQTINDSESVYGTYTFNSENGWSKTWDNLPLKDGSDNDIVYSVKEAKVYVDNQLVGTDRNTVSYSGNRENITDDAEITITNTYNAPSTTTKIRLKKTDSSNRTLSGAEFEITKDGGTPKTISDGTATELTGGDGTYTIKETKAPIGYKLAKNPISFTVTEGSIQTNNYITKGKDGVYEITFTDEPITFNIQKMDVTNGETELEGAHIQLYSGSECIDEWNSTKTAHNIDLSDLIFNKKKTIIRNNDDNTYTFRLKETSAPDGYIMVTEDTYFTVDEDGSVTVDSRSTDYLTADTTGLIKLSNKALKVKINKTDLGDNELEGAKIIITKKNDPSFASIEWTSTVKNKDYPLKDGDYTLTEDLAPLGYAVTTSFDFTVKNGKVTSTSSSAKITEDGNVTTIAVKDAPITFNIRKTDITGSNPLKGATLELYSVKTTGTTESSVLLETLDGSETADWVINLTDYLTGSNKVARNDDDTYTFVLKESSAPEGYERLDTEFRFTVDKYGKVVSKSETYLETSGSNNLIKLKNKALTVKLIKKYSNAKTGSFLQNKAEIISKTTFALFSDPSCAENTKITKDIAVNEVDGEFVVTFIATDVTGGFAFNTPYYLKETSDLSEYNYEPNDAVFRCTIDSTGKVTYTKVSGGTSADIVRTSDGFPVCENISTAAVTPEIVLIKTFKANGKEVTDASLTAKFGLYSDAECTDKLDEQPLHWLSGEAVVIFSNIEKDHKYYLKEITAPDGYQASDDVYVCWVDENSNIKYKLLDDPDEKFSPVFPPCVNIKVNDIGLIKTFKDGDEEVKDSSLEAEFQLYKKCVDGKPSEPLLTKSRAADWNNGTATVTFTAKDGIKLGETYYLQETKAPTGYQASDEIYMCNVGEDGIVKYKTLTADDDAWSKDFPTCENIKIGNIELNKTFVDSNGKEITDGTSSATFRLYNKDISIERAVTDGVVTFTSDDGIKIGETYYLKEVSAPGYEVSTDVIECTVLSTGKVSYKLSDGSLSTEPPTCVNVKISDSTTPGTNPSDPTTPDNSNNPENPNNPETPENPNNPENPENPNNPETPENPNNPENPENPSNPSNPGTPSNPGNPGAPSNPGNPGAPSNPGTPSPVPSTPSGSTNPSSENINDINSAEVGDDISSGAQIYDFATIYEGNRTKIAFIAASLMVVIVALAESIITRIVKKKRSFKS